MKRTTKSIGRSAPRLDQVSIVRVGRFLCGFAAIAFAGYVGVAGAGVEVLESSHATSVNDRALTRQLEALRAAWDPKERERILAGAPALAERFSGSLHRLLRRDDHPLLEQAVEFGAAMGAASLRGPLVDLVYSKGSLAPNVRAMAVKAADGMEPWTCEQLAEFVSRGTVPIRLAALEICATRADAPWYEIVQIVCEQGVQGGTSDEDWAAIREAAIQSVTERLPAVMRTELWEAVMIAESGPATAALRALARTAPSPDIASRLTGHLSQLDGTALRAGLDLLAGWGAKVADPGPIWALVRREDIGLSTRAAAFRCLENTRTFDAEEVRDALPALPPLLRYHGARCLLVAGRPEGLTCLLDLAEIGDGAASTLARQLLAWLTGRGPETERAAIEHESKRLMASLAKRVLPAIGDSPAGMSASPPR